LSEREDLRVGRQRQGARNLINREA